MRGRIMNPFTSCLSLIILLASWLPAASAIRMFESNSLTSCMEHSAFSASLFRVVFTPNNNTVYVNIKGESGISGFVKLDFEVSGYGYSIVHKVLDPCTTKELKGLCPMTAAPLNLPFNTPLPAEEIKKAPGVIYYIPDIDVKVKAWINDTSGRPLACVEATLSNGKTVEQAGVAWTVAVIALGGLVISAIMSGLGHSNTATHVASNSLSLFSYFQAQAFIGMAAVAMPPVVRGWTQNFQWSMGIIHVDFLQRLATWYQRATGGTPSTLLSRLATTSVHVQKRAIEAVSELSKRTNSLNSDETLKVVEVKGIERVGFLADIERTNIFFTGYTFFVIFALFVTLGVILFKYVCESLIRSGKMKPDKFYEFRSGWTLVLKGILFRVALIAFPQMVVLCLWEFTQRDSSAEVILAVSTFITITSLLVWGSWKVFYIAKRSIHIYNNPGYVLYSDPRVLNKWGFLYVQFKASMYWFIFPLLLVVFIKGAFIAFGQTSGVAQAIALVILEAGVLIALSIMRPYMDKKTNGFNIAIASINFLNVIFLLFFTGVLGVPPLAIGIMGVLFFLFNAVFSLVILLMTLYASIRAIISKDPDNRYQPMRDDRDSFVKSQTNLGNSTTELDALGATARGDSVRGTPVPFSHDRKHMDVDEESEDGHSGGPTPMRPGENPFSSGAYRVNSPPRSPMMRPGPPAMMRPDGAYGPGGFGPGYDHRGSSPVQYRPGSPLRPGTGQMPPPRTASPWQRGVGY